ncbi:type II toxin-antitoxin system HicB family antitoxin [Thermodesulforhabdus norvegica]|nr:type II toxin-antitoxin system HicB family antitoxin [Thermodesulforhabdus norvegica]
MPWGGAIILGAIEMKWKVVYRAEFFREGDLYVGVVPELDVSSYGESLDEARASLQEAVEAFLEECERMGTLEEVMEEAGFVRRGDTWLPRQPVAAELLTVGQ